MKYDYEDLYAAKKTYGQDINTSLGNAADPIDADQKLQEDALMSYVASVNYSYGDKYYASFSFRRDGSSACLPILVGGISGPCPLHGDFLRKSSCSR